MKQNLFLLIILFLSASCSSDDDSNVDNKTCSLNFKSYYQPSPNDTKRDYGSYLFVFPGNKEYKQSKEDYNRDMIFGINSYIAAVRKDGIAETKSGEKVSCLYKVLYEGTSAKVKELKIPYGSYYIMVIPYTALMESAWWACNNKYAEKYIDIKEGYILLNKTFWGDDTYRGLQGWDVPSTWQTNTAW